MRSAYLEAPAQEIRTPRILCVDDDANFVESIRRSLRKYKVEFNAAYDGLQAYATITASKPDLILIDLNMPVATGDETLVWLRGNRLVCETPVIVVSGAITHESEAAIRAAGADRVFAKPVRARTLIEAMQSFIDLQEADRRSF